MEARISTIERLQETQQRDLRDDILTLEMHSPSYMASRHAFLDNFRRNKLEISEDQATGILGLDNLASKDERGEEVASSPYATERPSEVPTISENYLQSRHTFLDNFKRDVLSANRTDVAGVCGQDKSEAQIQS